MVEDGCQHRQTEEAKIKSLTIRNWVNILWSIWYGPNEIAHMVWSIWYDIEYGPYHMDFIGAVESN